MLKPLRLGMVLHSKLSYLVTLLPNETPVCNLVVPLSGGSVGIRPPHAARSGPKSASQGRCQRRRGLEPGPW